MDENFTLKQRPIKKPKRLHVDLGDLKGPWLAYCTANGVTPSEATREVVRKLIQRSPAKPAPATEVQGTRDEGGGKIRKEVRLTESEARHAERMAAAAGFSVPLWIAALVRAQLTQNPQFGQKEQELLGESNYQLLALGRNLNQIAKSLNTAPEDRSVYRIDQIDDLRTSIKAHVKRVAAAMQSITERWKLI